MTAEGFSVGIMSGPSRTVPEKKLGFFRMALIVTRPPGCTHGVSQDEDGNIWIELLYKSNEKK